MTKPLTKEEVEAVRIEKISYSFPWHSTLKYERDRWIATVDDLYEKNAKLENELLELREIVKKATQ